ncbi:MAG: hypothetical protein V1689_09620 [Pseudomonadota bacterium]
MMKNSRSNNTTDQTTYKKKNRKRENTYDVEEGYIPRRRKNAGKRFHRKKTLKDEFWEDLTDKNS